jgi:hypothetical protein
MVVAWDGDPLGTKPEAASSRGTQIKKTTLSGAMDGGGTSYFFFGHTPPWKAGNSVAVADQDHCGMDTALKEEIFRKSKRGALLLPDFFCNSAQKSRRKKFFRFVFTRDESLLVFRAEQMNMDCSFAFINGLAMFPADVWGGEFFSGNGNLKHG